MINISELVFEYPGVRAINNVSLTIQAGDITALVGPNGAGKTTLMRCIAALETPLSGSITVDGIDVVQDPRLCHRKMGYLADFFGLYKSLTVKQCLSYFARAQLIPHSRETEAVELAARRLHLNDRMDQKAGTLSRGLAQRLAIAQAIVHEPQVIILDEPASGLDPEARHDLSKLFLELKQQGMTLLVSSHILSELEEYTDHMVIVKDGRVTEQKDIFQQLSSKVIVNLATYQEHPALKSILDQIDELNILGFDKQSCRFEFPNDQYQLHRLIKKLLEQGITVCEFSLEKANLQDAYLNAVGQTAEGK